MFLFKILKSTEIKGLDFPGRQQLKYSRGWFVFHTKIKWLILLAMWDVGTEVDYGIYLTKYIL